MTRRLKVAEGTQVTIDGKVYAAGESVDLDPHDADVLLERGTVVAEPEKAPAKRKATRGK